MGARTSPLIRRCHPDQARRTRPEFIVAAFRFGTGSDYHRWRELPVRSAIVNGHFQPRRTSVDSSPKKKRPGNRGVQIRSATEKSLLAAAGRRGRLGGGAARAAGGRGLG